MILNKMPSKLTRWSAVAAAVTFGLLVTSCSTGPSAIKETPSDGSPASLVPQEIRDRGYVTAAADATYPPIGFMAADGVTIVGLDADLAHELSRVLKLEIKHEAVSFDSIVPGLQGNKWDFGMSWINVTPEREKVVDFVAYSEDGSSILVLAAGTVKPKTLGEMCGLTVGVQKGTSQQSDLETQNKACESDGKSKIDLLVFPDQTAANLAVLSGRAQVTLADTPVAVYQQQQSDGKLEVSGKPYGAVYHGLAFPKDSALVPALAAAFQQIIDDGSYQKVLDKWDMGDAAIAQILVNGQPIK